MKEKCQFCVHDHDPRAGKPDACKECRDLSNFQLKTRMSPREAYMYDQIVKEEEWIADQSEEFDRDTALAVLKAISKNMHASHDLFGNPTLVINRYRFEAVRKKYLGGVKE